MTFLIILIALGIMYPQWKKAERESAEEADRLMERHPESF
jgi:hypothetical protein